MLSAEQINGARPTVTYIDGCPGGTYPRSFLLDKLCDQAPAAIELERDNANLRHDIARSVQSNTELLAELRTAQKRAAQLEGSEGAIAMVQTDELYKQLKSANDQLANLTEQTTSYLRQAREANEQFARYTAAEKELPKSDGVHIERWDDEIRAFATAQVAARQAAEKERDQLLALSTKLTEHPDAQDIYQPSMPVLHRV